MYCHHWDAKQLNIANHPISHFYRFSQLKSLKLTLPIFDNCVEYYRQLLLINFDKTHHPKCWNLKELSLEFVYIGNDGKPQSISSKFRPTTKIVKIQTEIDRICTFIFLRCRNVTNYTLLTNINRGDCQTNYKHLMGSYDQIETLETDTPSIISGERRMISLKKLT